MRLGTVYIAKHLGERQPGSPPYYGHWEVEERIAEQGPGWDTPEEAIAWGRERSAEVYVRLGPTGDSVYWAGDGSPPRDPYYPDVVTPSWPPPGWPDDA